MSDSYVVDMFDDMLDAPVIPEPITSNGASNTTNSKASNMFGLAPKYVVRVVLAGSHKTLVPSLPVKLHDTVGYVRNHVMKLDRNLASATFFTTLAPSKQPIELALDDSLQGLFVNGATKAIVIVTPMYLQERDFDCPFTSLFAPQEYCSETDCADAPPENPDILYVGARKGMYTICVRSGRMRKTTSLLYPIVNDHETIVAPQTIDIPDCQKLRARSKAPVTFSSRYTTVNVCKRAVHGSSTFWNGFVLWISKKMIIHYNYKWHDKIQDIYSLKTERKHNRTWFTTFRSAYHQEHNVECAAVSASGKLLAAAYNKSSNVSIWSLTQRSSTAIRTLTTHPCPLKLVFIADVGIATIHFAHRLDAALQPAKANRDAIVAVRPLRMEHGNNFTAAVLQQQLKLHDHQVLLACRKLEGRIESLQQDIDFLKHTVQIRASQMFARPTNAKSMKELEQDLWSSRGNIYTCNRCFQSRQRELEHIQQQIVKHEATLASKLKRGDKQKQKWLNLLAKAETHEVTPS
ncbi:hypothetical protein OAM67_00200 [bacterium]|nr:hypothetical protein [bacterium]